MKRYVKGSLTSGYVGIWWILNGEVIGDAVPLDKGYNDGSFINYDDFKNHSTEWSSTIKDNVEGDEADEIISQGFKSIERGRVVYNLRTQSYEIVCSESISKDVDALRQIISEFELQGCRYDVVPSAHYHIAKITGNPALDDLEYGLF